MQLEGGFQGRTNKLVDGCYSFWGAGDFPLLRAELQRRAWREQGDVQGEFQKVGDQKTQEFGVSDASSSLL